MKIIIVRHCDPDYQHDSLTERGFKERDALTEYLKKVDIKDIYVSTLGRARETAAPIIEARGLTPKYCDWLREFQMAVPEDQWDEKSMKGPYFPYYLAWDRYPSDWMSHEDIFGKDSWRTVPGFNFPIFLDYYDHVIKEFDQALADHGYVRDGLWYHTDRGNMDTIVFVCHFGVGCVLLSRLLNISPEVLWQMTLSRPSSTAQLITEEREKGIAFFRLIELGGTSHLYGAGLEPSESGLFKECYENDWQRQ